MNISDSHSINPFLEIEKISYPHGQTGILLGNIVMKVREGTLFEQYVNSFINFILTCIHRPRRWVELHIPLNQQNCLLYVKVHHLAQVLCLTEQENREMHTLLKANASLNTFIYQKIQQEIDDHLIFIEKTYPAEKRVLQDQLTEARETLRNNNSDKIKDENAQSKVQNIQQAVDDLEEKRRQFEALYGTAATYRFLAIPGFRRHAQQLFAVFNSTEPFLENMKQFIQEYNKIAPSYIHVPHPSVIDIVPFFKACLFYLQRKDSKSSDNIIQQIHLNRNIESDNLDDMPCFVYLNMLLMCLDHSA